LTNRPCRAGLQIRVQPTARQCRRPGGQPRRSARSIQRRGPLAIRSLVGAGCLPAPPLFLPRLAPDKRRGEHGGDLWLPSPCPACSPPGPDADHRRHQRAASGRALRDNPLHFQISAPVQPGNSRRPRLLDAHGNVVGIRHFQTEPRPRVAPDDRRPTIPQNINFAVKGSEALAFLAEHGVPPWRAAQHRRREARPPRWGRVAKPLPPPSCPAIAD